MAEVVDNKSAWILTFYGYKGGTGRTLCLANVARLLADSHGYRVGVVDFDLEAPGLPHHPLSYAWDRDRKSLQGSIEERDGFIDLFLAGHKQTEGMEQYTLDHIAKSATVFPTDANGRGGTVVLLSAGKGCVSLSHEYRDNLGKFTRCVADAGSECCDRTAEITYAILDAFITRFQLDYLFIDGRTGTGPFYLTYVYQLPHALVLFLGMNDQNVEGTLQILLAKSADDNPIPAPVFLAISPLPPSSPALFETRLVRLNEKLAKMRKERHKSPSRTQYVYEIPNTVEYLLPYTDKAAFEETYFHDYPHSQLWKEYVRLASAITSLRAAAEPIVSPKEQLADGLIRTLSSLGDDPLRVAAEDVTFRRFQHLLCDTPLRFKQPEKTGTTNGQTRMRFELEEPKVAIDVMLWSSTDKHSPWEMLVNQSEDTDMKSAKDYDVLLVPQEFLAKIVTNENFSERFHDFDTIRGQYPQLRGELSLLNYDYLQRWFPNWRRYCAHQQVLAATPFSAQSPMICANDELMDRLCKRYWSKRGIEPPTSGATFLPSSWEVLIEVIVASQGEDGQQHAYAIATEGRALYYEWISILLGLGDFDLESGQGNLITRIGLDENKVLRSTAILGHLVELLKIDVSEESGQLSMSETIETFAEKKAGLFSAWNDQFIFINKAEEWDTHLNLPPGANEDLASATRIRLCHLPTDILYDRRPLIAGWVALLPKQSQTARSTQLSESSVQQMLDSRLEAALRFLDVFLAPATQRLLLRKGFPSPSLRVVETERKAFNEELTAPRTVGREATHKQNYGVFLDSLICALTNGHAVPCAQKADIAVKKIEDTLRETLPHVSDHDVSRVSKKFKQLKDELGEEFKILVNDTEHEANEPK